MLCRLSMIRRSSTTPATKQFLGARVAKIRARESMGTLFASRARTRSAPPFRIRSKTFAFTAPGPPILFSCSRFRAAFGTVRQISSIPDDPQSRAPTSSLSRVLLFGSVRSLAESDTNGNWRGMIQMA